MKTREEILKILQERKPELVKRFGLTRLALFGSYARGITGKTAMWMYWLKSPRLLGSNL